jgi:hypothetical protein
MDYMTHKRVWSLEPVFGVLFQQTGTTPNTTLYSGEQFDRRCRPPRRSDR